MTEQDFVKWFIGFADAIVVRQDAPSLDQWEKILEVLADVEVSTEFKKTDKKLLLDNV